MVSVQQESKVVELAHFKNKDILDRVKELLNKE